MDLNSVRNFMVLLEMLVGQLLLKMEDMDINFLLDRKILLKEHSIEI